MSHEKPDLYTVLQPAFGFVLDRKYHRVVTGTENIPDEPALYAPNHIRFEDSPLIATSYTEVTGKPLRFGAKREYFDGEGIDENGRFSRSMKFLMQYTRMISVDREGTNMRSFQELQKQVTNRIENGDAVALHPEGTRSEDGQLYKFKSGIARIALALSVPIVPVGIVYDPHAAGRKTRVDIEFGEPVMPTEYTEPPYSELAMKYRSELLAQVVEDRVAKITGMPQTGMFAQLRKLRSDRSE